MRSYIKVMGPPILDAMRKLEELAVGMPEVCIMDQALVQGTTPSVAVGTNTGSIAQQARGYFTARRIAIPLERCGTIISRHGERLGDYDFFFEWSRKPTSEQIEDLIGKIDAALKPLGCLYTITSK